ncbi:lysM and putative peptidoglycan-binding domain-containing protein 1 [Acipenser oxyrinchus oxyrinchus]|uniref:LysM and putative peptidoglycan-binding domain-containing protein 1 n=1 Tax=Acipenser oxyrinchus oxyrinchus TaxID=40147 RepID=A0AAD8FRK9_ACIOX|nr:lysM and putative peptidoglycan-binding domain-containing protein 1 [Acipenser oxyrinchus oxyrinchus]
MSSLGRPPSSSFTSSSSSGGEGLLSGSRTRSYGSLVRSPVRERQLEHLVQPGETLQGLALKYGVTMEHIKRANRLYTNDSIFLKKSLFIPVFTNREAPLSSQSEAGKEEGAGPPQGENGSSANGAGGGGASDSRPADLSAADFLKRLDGLISQSKEAAVKKIQEGGEKGLLEGDAPFRASAYHSSRGQSPSPRTQQRALLGPVPLTKTRLTKSLRDHEDEIFKL